MALTKDKTLDTGFVASYWIVREIKFDQLTKTSTIRVQCFKDQTFKNENPDRPAFESDYHFDDEAFFLTVEAMTTVLVDPLDPSKGVQFLGKNPVELTYNKLKTIPDFSGAVDA